VKLGGKLTIKEGTGGQYGECALPSGKICEERALYRGECSN
jgi:putative hemolysin